MQPGVASPLEIINKNIDVEQLVYPSGYALAGKRVVKPGTSPRIVHLCWMDAGGAGIAAYRLHKGLEAIGADTTMLVLQKNHFDATVRTLPAVYNQGSEPSSADFLTSGKMFAKNDRRWRLLISQYPKRPKDAELFTDTVSDVKLEYVKEVQEADIINLHWVAGVIDYRGLPVAFAEKPVVWTLHDMNPFTGGCHYAGPCVRYAGSCGSCPGLGSNVLEDISWHFHRQKEEALADLYMHIVTPSRWLGECSSKSSLFGGFAHHVIPYGLPTQTFRPFSREGVRRIYDIPQNAFVILFGAAALHIKRKGYAFLLDALNRLAKSHKEENIILGVYGAFGDDMILPEKFPHVIFGPVVNEESLAMIYSASDLFVIPTLEDNLPNTVIEAFACGVPVVGFKTGGVPDMIEHEKNGYLVEQGNVDGLIDGILWARSLGDSAKGVSEYCRKTAVDRYDETIQARAYYELYSSILKQRDEAISHNKNGEDAAMAGDTERAMGCFNEAIKSYPKLSRPYNNMGVVYWQQGEADKASECFQSALKVNPDDRTALLNISDSMTGSSPQNSLFLSFVQPYLDRHPGDDEINSRLITVMERELDTVIKAGDAVNSMYDDRDYIVTVIVLVINPNGFLDRILKDIVSQSMAGRIEIVCIDAIRLYDDLSFFSETAGKHRNFLYYRPPYPLKRFEALNLGVRLAKGSYCMAVMNDDRLDPSACKNLMEALEKNSECMISYGNTCLTETAEGSIEEFVPSPSFGDKLELSQFEFKDIINRYNVGPHPMWRRSLHNEIGYFDTRYEVEADQDLWLRTAKRYRSIHLPVYTGLIWLNKNVPLRLPVEGGQFSRISSKYRRFPHFYEEPSVLEERGQVDMLLGQMKKTTEFFHEITKLVENGKNREALELYDKNRKGLPNSPELKRFDGLMEKIRGKMGG